MATIFRIIPKHFSLFFLSVIIILSSIYYYKILRPQKEFYNLHHVPINGFYLMDALPIKDLKLTDINGNDFTKDNLKNHWTLLYFGFTHCKVICPNSMALLSSTYQILQKKLKVTNLPKIAFVSIDPDRDTLSKIRKFVISFGPEFIGLRGNYQTTAAVEAQFHVPVKKVQGQNAQTNDYVLNHGIDIVLINPEAKIQAYFTYPQKPEQLAHDYEAIVNKYQLLSGKVKSDI